MKKEKKKIPSKIMAPLRVVANLLKGSVVGASNAIPAISGGTVLLLLGIYDPFITHLSGFYKGKKQLLEALAFVLPVILGIGVGVVAISRLLVLLLELASLPVFALFAGMVLGSIPLVLNALYKSVDKNNIVKIDVEVGGQGMSKSDSEEAETGFVEISKNDSEGTEVGVEKSLKNSVAEIDVEQVKEKKAESVAAETVHIEKEQAVSGKTNKKSKRPSSANVKVQPEAPIKFKPTHIIPLFIAFSVVVTLSAIRRFVLQGEIGPRDLNVETGIMLVIMGVLSLGTIALPGLSGSLILMLAGYFTTVNRMFGFILDYPGTYVPMLLLHGLGMIIGLLSAAKGAKILIKKFKVASHMAVAGFLLGSVVAIFIFEETYVSGTDTLGIVLAVLLFVAGTVGAFLLSKLQKGKALVS